MESDYEPMDQDCDEGGDSLQVKVSNDLFKTADNDDVLDFETDDLEITDFPKANDELATILSTSGKEEESNKIGTGVTNGATEESISISVLPVDDDNESTKEDGEISETHSQSGASDNEDGSTTKYFSRSSSMRSSRRKNDIRRERSPIARRYPNPYLDFDDDKIQSRALRFGLPNSSGMGVASTEVNPKMPDEDLLNLYISCGLIQDDGGKLTLDKVSPNHRLDSILIRGTNHMNTNEIFKYLYDLGQKPVAMEWVNDAMCVVIFKDSSEAAASLVRISKPILMDPRICERKRSMVQVENDKEKEDASEEKSDSTMNVDIDYGKVEAVPQSWITVPMPPGHIWRFGAPCEKAKGILMRFANKQDKKQERAERFSEYYKNYGNPNKIGNSKDNSGEDRNRRRKKLRPENNSTTSDSPKEDYNNSSRKSSLKLNPNDKNGWSQLSAMWDDEEAFQRSARDRFSSARQYSKESDTSGISPMKKQEATKDSSTAKTVDARELIRTRQKRKRGINSSDEEGAADSDEDNNDDDDDDDRLNVNVNDWKDNGSFRRKRESRNDDDDGDNIQWRERLPGPRMRMHADEEEERIKRRAFRRLGHKRGDSSQQTNYWDFGRDRDSSNNSSFRSKSGARRPVSERLGSKRNPPKSNNDTEELSGDGTSSGGFDLRQKLLNMRKVDNEEEDLHNLIYYYDTD